MEATRAKKGAFPVQCAVLLIYFDTVEERERGDKKLLAVRECSTGWYVESTSELVIFGVSTNFK